MKQNAHQSVDAYMSQLRLALPECKFKNDSDDLLKDQFIFGIHNKEIQDHLLGEISEVDNSIKSLYKARKIESKLEQRKLLGIVTPDRLVDVNIVKKKKVKFQKTHDCDYCGCSHDKGNCPAYGKTCNRCGMKNHFAKKCKQNDSNSKSRNRSRSKGDHDQKCKSCGKSKKEFNSIKIDSDDCDGSNATGNQMEDLTEQVQSLFYH